MHLCHTCYYQRCIILNGFNFLVKQIVANLMKKYNCKILYQVHLILRDSRTNWTIDEKDVWLIFLVSHSVIIKFVYLILAECCSPYKIPSIYFLNITADIVNFFSGFGTVFLLFICSFPSFITVNKKI